MSTKNMHLRRKDRLQTAADAKRIMECCDFAVLSTADTDLVPYGVPVSTVLEDDHLYFHCATVGRKLENIRQNARVCLTFSKVLLVDGDNFTIRYESVIAEGTASLIEAEAEKTHALRLLSRRYTQHNDEAIDAYIQRYFAQTAIVRIDLDTVCAKANKTNI